MNCAGKKNREIEKKLQFNCNLRDYKQRSTADSTGRYRGHTDCCPVPINGDKQHLFSGVSCICCTNGVLCPSFKLHSYRLNSNNVIMRYTNVGN